jgi:hypothetical protein
MALVGSLLKKGIHFSNIVANRRKAGLHQQQKKTLAKLLAKAGILSSVKNTILTNCFRQFFLVTKVRSMNYTNAPSQFTTTTRFLTNGGLNRLKAKRTFAGPVQIKYYALSSGTSEAAHQAHSGNQGHVPCDAENQHTPDPLAWTL